MSITHHLQKHYDVHLSTYTAVGASIAMGCNDRAEGVFWAMVPGLGIFIITTLIKWIFKFDKQGL